MRLSRLLSRIERRVLLLYADNPATNPNKPVNISREQTKRARFAFLGEFGFELIAWLPYLWYLKEEGYTIRTIGRPGSTIFYPFADEHIEVTDATLLGHGWGAPSAYAKVAEQFSHDLLVFPGPENTNRKQIVVGGKAWTNKNINVRIQEENYRTLDYSHVPPWSPISDKPFIVLNNKYYRQWPIYYDAPVNYFGPVELAALRDLLLCKGYGVVYNHYVEPTGDDPGGELQDRSVFGTLPATHDLRDRYAECRDEGERNRIQLGLYHACSAVIGVQGGNLYLPAICRRPFYMLMRAGTYQDYLELGRLYKVKVEAFYEPRHLLHWLEAHLPEQR
jgi:hypothetical protein